MNFLLKINTYNRSIQKKNEGIKHGSYARVLQDRRKCAFIPQRVKVCMYIQ